MSTHDIAEPSTTRNVVGRILCTSLGALYAAGLAPLFTFGERGKQIWQTFESAATSLTSQLGVPEIVSKLALGSLTFAGPLALVWFLAGKGINRILWFALGLAAYASYRMYG